ncbi:Diguanylate cyclase/phosphodiesterase with PAS/PAC sensor(S) [Pseudodesulfovibrio profundus]|uniref:Diguanylate cyclase/phosphodiesterase with PAS/PAC sensor(S) n=1 Tax=Pseudodesulfovibrio profundus TaxID=57320 RepID=A0A2C8FAC9_9BACT|nr:EAL domain-containing protein [Pseudodesulfovibrio profundus]MBC15983.1 diguanylate cyclase [Desulfovibrio sp.]SOB59393.1 Diguanylate cyclase/phosphodiesterase with PAS/PAC sensor(S) [Pseudodesulfovibrio profundus]|tara:strand:- start:823 stop:3393 length:2571 start_codon:yes stop_codon:yes gene_type:complete
MKAPKLFLKPLLFMFLLFGVLAVVTSFMFTTRLKREMTREYESKALALASSVAESDIESILQLDAGSVQARIAQYQDIAGVSYVVVTDDAGEVIAHTFTPQVPEFIQQLSNDTAKLLSGDEHLLRDVTFNDGPNLHVARPILSGLGGYVHIGMDSKVIEQNIRESVMEQQLLTLTLFGASTILAFLFFHNLSRPLGELADYARRVANKDFSDVPVIKSKDEVGQLATAMQSMAMHIAELVTNLEQRVKEKTSQLEEARDALKDTVEERTSELIRANTQLKIEIAERKVIGEALRKTEKKYRSIFENAVEGIYQTSPSGRFLSANPAMARILGYSSPEDLMGAIYDIGTQMYVDPKRRTTFLEHIQDNDEVISFVSKIRRKDGRIIWISENTRLIRDTDGSVLYYEGSVEDITLRKKAEDQLKRQAFHDSLTGLPNRALFLDHLHMAMARAKRRKHLFAVIYMDLDRFKVINDSLGHDTGDELLRNVARILETCARETDTVARFGGDEFAILLEEITAPRDAITIARRILDGVRQPFHIQGHEVFTSASMGIVLKTDGYERPEALLRDADTAMYRAKELGKSRFKVFNQKMHDQALMLMALETDLRRAVDLNEFEVVYQPIICLETREVCGFEALVRWRHPKHGMISPDQFIPLAEDTGLIYAIDSLVLRNACLQITEWQNRFGTMLSGPLTLNINVSGKHFGQSMLPGQVKRALEDSSMAPEHLNLEITESALMDNPSIAEDILKQLKNLGIHVCIDDFGTGYSSLSYLQRFPIDVVKVDRSFISDVEDNLDSQAIVRTVFSLGESLGLKIVAEGVETPKQLIFLESEGCRYVQGFLFYKPLSVEEATSLLVKASM